MLDDVGTAEGPAGLHSNGEIPKASRKDEEHEMGQSSRASTISTGKGAGAQNAVASRVSETKRGKRSAADRQAFAAPTPRVTDCQIINSLARGLKVLSAFDPDDTILSNKDLAFRTSLPKPTISRLTNTLVRLNFLTYEPETGGYCLGPAALSLGISATGNVDLGLVARPFLQSFAEEHGLVVTLGVRDGLEVRSLGYTSAAIYEQDDAPPGVRMMLGARVSLALSANGHALLAGMSLQERVQVFQGLEEQARDNWNNVRRRIEFSIAEVAREGYCSSLREWDGTVNSAAVPLNFSRSGIPLALSCAGSVQDVPESRIRNTLGPALVDLTAEIRKAFEAQSVPASI